MDEFELEEGPVSGEDLIGEIANLYPETQEFLMSLGMHCLGCPSSQMETIAEAAMVRGYDADDLVDEINSYLSAKAASQPAQA